MLSSFSLFYIKFKKVKILWGPEARSQGPGAGYENRRPGPREDPIYINGFELLKFIVVVTFPKRISFPKEDRL